DMPDLARANYLRLRGESHERVDLAIHKELHRSVVGSRRDPFDVRSWIYADIGQHDRHVDMVMDSEPTNGHAFALEVPDGTDSLVAEEFVAASVNAGKHDNGLAGVECRN